MQLFDALRRTLRAEVFVFGAENRELVGFETRDPLVGAGENSPEPESGRDEKYAEKKRARKVQMKGSIRGRSIPSSMKGYSSSVGGKAGTHKASTHYQFESVAFRPRTQKPASPD